MQELELRLVVAASGIAKARSGLLAMAGRPRAVRASVVTTHYDTEDGALRQRDLALRVRKQGRAYFQTVTATAQAGDVELAQSEWEDQIRGAAPDVAAQHGGSHLPPALGADALRPLFTIRLQRTSFTLRPRPGTEIAVAMECGEIRADDGDAVEPISEIALVLVAGDRVVLWDVALRLLEIVPCRIATESHAARGYRLVAGGQPPVCHAQPIALDPKAALDTALQVIGRRSLAVILRNEAAAVAGIPDGVHQMRVAVRRLRAALAALKPMLPPEHFNWANGELRFLSGELGPARNWDVFAVNLLAPVSAALPTEPELATLGVAVAREREAAYDHLRAALHSERYTAAMLRLSRWFDARGWRDQPVSADSALLVSRLDEVAADLLDRLHRKARKRAKHLAVLDPVQRHKLRIALKKLRYAVESFDSLFEPRAVAHFVRRVKPLQDDLGHTNDVRSAHGLVAALGDEDGASLERASGIVLGWHDRGLADAEPQTRRHARRFRRVAKFW